MELKADKEIELKVDKEMELKFQVIDWCQDHDNVESDIDKSSENQLDNQLENQFENQMDDGIEQEYCIILYKSQNGYVLTFNKFKLF